MNLIAKKNIFLSFSALCVIVSIISIGTFGLKKGIDLTGGTRWEIEVRTEEKAATTEDKLKAVLEAAVAGKEVKVSAANEKNFIMRISSMTTGEYETYKNAIKNSYAGFEEKSLSNVGPVIGGELRTQAMWAMVLVIVGISLYIAYAFRKVSEPVRSWKYGIITLVTLFHDVVIPTGFLAMLGRWKGIEIDTNTIVALLLVMGFSVHDTIVVFDRIREHLLGNQGKHKNKNLGDIINESVNETFARSINTSFTLILVLVTLLFLGPSSLFYFILTILIGTIFGTYSSIFVASPLLYIWNRSQK